MSLGVVNGVKVGTGSKLNPTPSNAGIDELLGVLIWEDNCHDRIFIIIFIFYVSTISIMARTEWKFVDCG